MKKRPKGALGILIAALAVIAVVFIARTFFTGPGPEAEKGKSFFAGGETRPVLDPSMFTGMTREAYAAAQKYPQVMDGVFCYCYCDQPPFNHKSLLSCFVDEHAAG